MKLRITKILVFEMRTGVLILSIYLRCGFGLGLRDEALAPLAFSQRSDFTLFTQRHSVVVVFSPTSLL